MVAISQNIVNSLTGSTLDIQKLATELTAAVRAPQQAALDTKKSLADARVSSIGKITSSANNLKTAMAGYGDPKAIAYKLVPDKNASFQFHVASPPRAVDFTFQVNHPASANSLMLAGFPNDGALAGADGTGVLNIYGGTRPADPLESKALIASFKLTDYATLDELKTAIQNQTGFTASIVSSGSAIGSLQYLSISHGLGADNKFYVETLKSDGAPLADGLQPSSDAAAQTNGQDAEVSYNGITFTSPTNKFADLVPDLEITINADTPANSTVHLSTTSNTQICKEALQDIVTAYNSLLTTVKTEAKYDKDVKLRGGLANDAVARGLLNQMRLLSTDPIKLPGGKTVTLAEVGVRTNLDGSLAIDTVLMDKVIANSPGLLESVVASGDTPGAIERFTKLTDVVVGPSSSFKSISDTVTNTELPKIADAITKLNDEMDALQAKYLKQFSAMQAIVNASKTVQDSLTQSMASWTAGLKN
jgi:flagellar hook-associated protein 2